MSRRLVVLLLITTVLVGSCRRGDDGDNPSRSERPRAASANVPEQVLGLAVVAEDVSNDVAEVQSPTYIGSVALFSLREADLFQAGLQVSSLTDVAEPDSPAFRRRIVGLMGGSLEEMRVGDVQVFRSAGKQQVRYAWFKGRGFFVLTVRQAYPFRRTLLRRLLEVEEPA